MTRFASTSGSRIPPTAKTVSFFLCARETFSIPPRRYCLVQRDRTVLSLAPIPLTALTDHFPANALWLEVPLFDVGLPGLGEPLLYLPSTFGRQDA